MTPAGSGWLLRLPSRALRAAARLRGTGGIEIALDGDAIWLRGDGGAEGEPSDALLALDADLRGRATGDGLFISCGETVPSGAEPARLEWRPLAEVPPLSLPIPIAGDAEFAKAPVRLKPSSEEAPARLLHCGFAPLLEWGVHAPESRLAPLRFAASPDGRALVAGEPLPPLQGRRFAVERGVGYPLGFGWSPPIPASSLRAAASAREGDLIVFLDPSRPPVRLDAELFVPLSRAALRATRDAMAGEGGAPG